MTERFVAADDRITEVLNETLAEDLREIAIVAMVFSGNSARQQDKTGEAVSWYERSLAQIEEA